MGIVSTTRTILYCSAGVLATGCIGFSLNAYFLKLLRDDIKHLREEVATLKTHLTTSPQHKTEHHRSDEESEDEFHIALESFPSHSAMVSPQDLQIDCTDKTQCPSDVLTLCNKIDDKHDLLKLTEQGCKQSVTYLQQLNKQYPGSPQLLWRLARILFEEAKHNIRNGLDAKHQLLESLKIAEQCVQVGENNSKCHLWYAILLGDTCKYDDTKVKLTKGMEFDKHVRIALKLDPYNSTALHLLGRYCYEVSGIKWWEAKIAAALFGSVPSSSYEEALQFFLKADELNSEWVENTMFITKCLVNLNRENEAKVWLKKISMNDDMEPEIQSQINEIKNRL